MDIQNIGYLRDTMNTEREKIGKQKTETMKKKYIMKKRKIANIKIE